MERIIYDTSKKVAIVGTGFVGSTAAYTIMMSGVASCIALIDKNKAVAEGHALDLMHGVQFTPSIKVVAGDSFELVRGASVVVITAGMAQKEGQTRAELLKANSNIFKQIVPEIIKHNKDCILLVVTNPLDVMTYLTFKLSGFPSCRVFGTGTVLDTSRLRYLMSSKLQISAKDITAYILGEHGDSQFVWWSSANIAGIPMRKMHYCTKEFLEKIHEQVRSAVYEVINKKGATYYAIALVISKIVRAILLNQSRVFTVSTVLKDYRGVSDVCLSVPTIVRSSGICQKLPVIFDEKEEKKFKDCVEKIKLGIKEAFI